MKNFSIPFMTSFLSIYSMIHSFYYYHLLFLICSCENVIISASFITQSNRVKNKILAAFADVYLLFIQWVCNLNLLEKTIETYIKIIYLFYIGIVFISNRRWKRKSVIRCKRKIKK